MARALSGETQGEFARRAGVAPSLLSRFEGGHSPASRSHLDRLAAAAGLSLSFLEQVVEAAEALAPRKPEANSLDSPQPLRGVATGRTEDLVAEITRRLSASIAPALVAVSVTPARAQNNDRAPAVALWQILAPLPARARRLLALGLRGAENPAFCALLCDESFDTADRDPPKASVLADLALSVAEKLPEPLGVLARGYALAFLGHAKRLANELLAAEGSMAQSAALLGTLGGAVRHADFPLARVFALEASQPSFLDQETSPGS